LKGSEGKRLLGIPKSFRQGCFNLAKQIGKEETTNHIKRKIYLSMLMTTIMW